MEENSQVNDVVYKWEVTRTLPKKTCRVAKGEWKGRFYNRKLSFKHKKTSSRKTFSSYMWHLKNVSSETPNSPPYSKYVTEMSLKLMWKLEIIEYQTQRELLNKRSKLFCKYCYAKKFLLKNYTNNDFS